MNEWRNRKRKTAADGERLINVLRYVTLNWEMRPGTHKWPHCSQVYNKFPQLVVNLYLGWTWIIFIKVLLWKMRHKEKKKVRDVVFGDRLLNLEAAGDNKVPIQDTWRVLLGVLDEKFLLLLNKEFIYQNSNSRLLWTFLW